MSEETNTEQGGLDTASFSERMTRDPEWLKNAKAAIAGDKSATETKAPQETPDETKDTKEAPAVGAEQTGEGTPPEKTEAAQDTKPDDEPPPVIKGKAREEWDKLKAKHAAELKAVQEEIERIKKATPPKVEPTEDIDGLKKERDQLSELIRTMEVERHPKFQEYFGKAVEQQLTKAKAIVGEEKAGEVAELLSMPESRYRTARLDELMAELPPSNQTRLGAVMDKLDDIRIERQNEIAKSKENYTKITQMQAAERAKQQAEYIAAFDSTHTKLAQEFEFLKPKDGDAAWNQTVQQDVALAKKLYSGEADNGDVAKALLFGASARRIMEHAKTVTAELVEAKKQLAELQKAKPSPADGAPPDQKSDGDVPQGNTVNDMMARAKASGLPNRW